MNDNVLRFDPLKGQALENVPHMLRYWADVLERGEKKCDAVILVMQPEGGPLPGFAILGTPHAEPLHPLYVAGIFDACRHAMVDEAFHASAEQEGQA